MKGKNRLTPKGAVLFIVLPLVLLGGYLFYGRSGSAWEKTGLSVRGWDDIQTVETAGKDPADTRAVYFLGRSGGKYIRVNKIENAGNEESETYVADESIKIECLFNRKALPYPGFVSDYTEPDPGLLPAQGMTAVEGRPVKYYLFYADEKFRPCLYKTDPVRYRTILFFLYNDRKKDLYKVEVFVPKNEPGGDAGIADLSGFGFKEK